MKRVYLIYIKLSKEINNKYMYFTDYDNVVYEDREIRIALYAYSKNKKYVHTFMDTRKEKLFFVKEVLMKDEEYRKLKTSKILYRLHENLFGYHEIATYNEFVSCDDYCYDIISIFYNNFYELRTDIFTDYWQDVLYRNGYMDDYTYFGISDFYRVDKIVIFTMCYQYLLNEKFFQKLIKDGEKS